MPKPTVLPRWANVGGAVSTPSVSKLDVGWLPGEVPPAQFANWLGLHNYNWAAWLDALFPSDNLVLDANKSVTVSGTGLYKRPARARRIAGAHGVAISGTVTRSASYVVLGSAGAVVEFPITVQEGERLTSVTLRCTDGGADQVNLQIFRIDLTGASLVETQLGTTQSSVGSGGALSSVTVSGLTETVDSTFKTYVARCTQAGGAASGIILNGILYTTDVP